MPSKLSSLFSHNQSGNNFEPDSAFSAATNAAARTDGATSCCARSNILTEKRRGGGVKKSQVTDFATFVTGECVAGGNHEVCVLLLLFLEINWSEEFCEAQPGVGS